MHPDEVGHLVLDAILHDQFWIFTDPTLLRHVQEQVDVRDRPLAHPAPAVLNEASEARGRRRLGIRDTVATPDG
jgi:hypothetical protein